MARRVHGLAIAVAALLVMAVVGCGSTELASQSTNGTRTTLQSQAPAISADGNVVAFFSDDGTLDDLRPDANGVANTDVFVHDFTTGVTERVNYSSSGVQANGDMWGYEPSLSGDGRYVAFPNSATNLAGSPPGGFDEIYVRDRTAHTTSIVSVSSAGAPANAASGYPFITASGRYVAFESPADNLVAGDTNSSNDVYVHDRDADDDGLFDEPGAISTVRVNLSTAGAQGDVFASDVTISGDGRFAVFMSPAGNLTPDGESGRRYIYLRDRDTDVNGVYDEAGGVATTKISFSCAAADPNCISGIPRISANASTVVYVQTATIAVDPEQQADGSYHVYAYDRSSGTTRRLDVSTSGGPADGMSQYADASSTGRYVSFWSAATNLGPSDTNGKGDFFVRDRDTDANGVFDEPGQAKTELVSVSSAGVQHDGNGIVSRISADGRRIAFESSATNLVPPTDNNGVWDIFRRTMP